MFEFITNTENRGQVGIGTLIVFIAMVLVAAIAAGVLINTAGFLQTQAEATGQDSTDLVSERIDVTSEVGIIAPEPNDDQLSEIRLTVSGAPGADDIDLADTTLQAVGPGGQANLVFTDQPTEEVVQLSSASDVPVGGTSFDITINHDNIQNNGNPITVGAALNGGTETTTTTTGTGTETVTISADDTGDIALGNTGETFADGDDIAISLTESNIDEITATETVADGNTIEVTTTNDLSPNIENLDGNEFAVGSDGSFESTPVLNSENQYTILINPSAGAFNEGTFGEGQTATIDLVSPAGATTTVELRAPDLFGDAGGAVRL
jgi:flagellin FlaB